MATAHGTSERVTREELLAAARAQGVSGMSEFSAMVLDTDGTLSVLRNSARGKESTLRSVSDQPQE